MSRLGRFALGALALSAVSFAIVGSLADWATLDIGGPSDAIRSLGCRALRLTLRDGVSAGAEKTLPLPWTGGDTVSIDIPATVLFQPGPAGEASVTGEADLVDHLRLKGGRLTWEGGFDCHRASALTLRLQGPPPAAWRVNGSGSLALSNLQQEKLAIAIRGSGKIEATGAVRELTLDIAGSGRADLRALAVEALSAHIRGSANADIAPREDADITVAGSALVTIHGHPAHLRTRVAGSGEIRQEP